MTCLVVTCWVAAPVAAVYSLTRDVAATSFASPRDVWTAVRELSGESTERLGLALAWAPGPTLVAPAWDGLVEVVHIAPGEVLSSGDVVAVVGGVTRTAHAGERPLSRSLRSGDRGPDVQVLNGFLAGRGLPHADGDRFTTATTDGVRALAVSIGAGRQDSFDPTWLLHMTAPVLTIESIDLTVGAPAPEPGRAVVAGVPSLVSAVVTTQDFAARVATAALPDTGGTGGTVRSSPSSDVGDHGRTVPPEAELRSGDVRLALTPERDRLDLAGLQALAAVIPPGSVAAEVAAVTPPAPGRWVLPAAAVFATEQGGTAVRRQRVGLTQTVAVAVVGSDGPSTTVVTGDLATGDRVQLAPDDADRSLP